MEAAKNTQEFTKLLPMYFPDTNITRKMHILSFVLPKIIENDETQNICYKFLKVERAGERFHQIWNTLTRTRFFSVRDKKLKLLYTFKEYKNYLYLNKSLLKKILIFLV